MSSLNVRQQKFADAYIETGNATQAYIAAGYDAQGDAIRVNASRLLTNANIAAYVREKSAEAAEAVGVSRERVVEEIAKIAFVPVGSNEHISTANKLDAIEKLARFVNLYQDDNAGKATQVILSQEPIDPDEWARQFAPSKPH